MYYMNITVGATIILLAICGFNPNDIKISIFVGVINLIIGLFGLIRNSRRMVKE